MNMMEPMAGVVEFKIVTADIPGLLHALEEADIELLSAVDTDDLTLQGSVYAGSYDALCRLTRRRGEELHKLRQRGILFFFQHLRRRMVLTATVALLAILTIFIPTRIFFIRVQGNDLLATQEILQQAEACGIRFGAKRSAVRSEKMKNALLDAVPKLQWAGVNTKGCVATITVREKSMTPALEEKLPGISSIVAACDGIVESCTATSGTLLCKPGDAVVAGQTLISGYTDCGLTLRGTHADGEITALTQHDLSVMTLALAMERGETQCIRSRYSIKIGKKLINFYKDSGILDSTCVKMYSQTQLRLPGGFLLPITFIKEQYTFTDLQEQPQVEFDWLADFSKQYLQQRMVAGAILSESPSLCNDDCSCMLQVRYICREMIGTVRNEEIINYNGKND